MDWYLKALGQYANFSGRAGRREFWIFTLVNVAIFIILKIISFDIITIIFSLAILIPSLAVQVRRLHDIGKSGLWVLINLVPIIGFIVLIVFCVREGEPGANDYGPHPDAV